MRTTRLPVALAILGASLSVVMVVVSVASATSSAEEILKKEVETGVSLMAMVSTSCRYVGGVGDWLRKNTLGTWAVAAESGPGGAKSLPLRSQLLQLNLSL